MGWQIPNSNLKNEQKIVENAAEIAKLKLHTLDNLSHVSYAVNTSTIDSYEVTIPGITEYTEGMIVSFLATVANTTTCSLNINGLGAHTIYKFTTSLTNLETGDIAANQIVSVIYNGTVFIMISPLANSVTTHGTQTLAYKTLTAPKIVNGGFIADSNGNEILKVLQTTSAVNEFTVKNAATGNAPELQATGNDVNVDINLVPKGSGVVKVGGKQVALKETLDTHSTQAVAQMIPVARNLTLTGVQRVSTNFKAKSISIFGFVSGTKLTSNGFWAENNTNRTVSTDINGVVLGWSTLLRFSDNNTLTGTINTTLAEISNITNDGFDLTWTKTGAGAYAGDAILLIVVHGHGGGA